MEAWVSWAIFLALGGSFGYYYYTSNNRRARHRGRPLQRAAPVAATTRANNTQRQDSASTSKATAKAAKAKPKTKAPRKSVKNAFQEVGDKAGSIVSAATSAVGLDADDDVSPTASPGPSESKTIKAPSGKDVSDMLEPGVGIASVLRINPSEKPGQKNKSQQQRKDAPQESKKQRQNRKKVEEAKAQREEEEKERQKLLEKQRRTAREARGEPARNGLKPAQAPASNAWTTGRGASAVAPSPAQGGQLLDTFEQDVVSTGSSSEAATNGTVPTPDSLSNSGHWIDEDEQLRLALEDSAWTEVPKKKKGRKSKTAEDTAEEGSESSVTQEAPPVKNIQAKPVESTKARSRYDVLAEPTNGVSHPLDSDWSVA